MVNRSSYPLLMLLLLALLAVAGWGLPGCPSDWPIEDDDSAGADDDTADDDTGDDDSAV
jgi:hypothetical protein